MKKIFLFDSETGGIDPHAISLLSLYGMVLTENLDVLDTIELKVKPDDGIYRVQAAALKVNKIDLVKHDETAATEQAASRVLWNFLYKHTNFGTEKLVPAGHNIGRLDIPMLEKLLVDYNSLFIHRSIDTGSIGQYLQLTGRIPSSNNGSLAELCKYFGIDTTGHHDAKTDVEMTYKLLKAMVKCGVGV